MSPTRRDFLKYTGAAGLLIASGDLAGELIAQSPKGNPLTSSLLDYAFPTANELPRFETDRTVTPTHLNALGVKGIGESGTIGSTPAVQNAVIDAVAHLGVRHIDMPLTPERVWNAIREASA